MDAAERRNVSIQIVANKDKNSDLKKNEDLRRLSQLSNVEIRRISFFRLVGAGILHTKFITIDGENFYVGSANMDWRSLSEVKELGITVTSCPMLTEDVNKIFKVYWQLAATGKLPESWPDYTMTKINKENPASISLNRTASAVYLSSSPKELNPPDRTNDINAILDVINSAKKFIYIAVMDYSPTFFFGKKKIYWPVIDEALRRAAYEKNVTVRIM